jgi:phosphate:Na+ symporter
MQHIFTTKAKDTIAEYTNNLFSSLFIGIVLTILLGSSSAVIILAIVFINAESLNLKQAIGIILGANIGTTFSSQLIALDIGKYAVIPMVVGVVLMYLVKNEKYKQWGKVLFYFGMLFLGLFVMQESVSPLKDSERFSTWIMQVENNPIKGILTGGLVTLIIQSSSGTVGMAIVLAKQNLLIAPGAIAIMLGAELGTCSDTLIATIKGKRQAIKAGIFHLGFNLTTILIGLIFFSPFVTFIEWISQHQRIGGLIANAHMLFNTLGVLLMLPFVGLAEKGLNRLIPESDK